MAEPLEQGIGSADPCPSGAGKEVAAWNAPRMGTLIFTHMPNVGRFAGRPCTTKPRRPDGQAQVLACRGREPPRLTALQQSGAATRLQSRRDGTSSERGAGDVGW